MIEAAEGLVSRTSRSIAGKPVFGLLLLAFATGAATYASAALGSLQEALRADLALSDNQIAWLQGPALALPAVLGSLPLGLLVDRTSRVRLLFLFMALDFAATILGALAFNFAVLIAARGLVGLARAATMVAAYSLVADLSVPIRRGRAVMLVVLGDGGGAPAAFALGGVLLVASGSPAGSVLAGWRWALLWMSAPLLPIALMILMLREPARTAAVVGNPPMRDVWAELWRYRAVIGPLLLARIMVLVADCAVAVWAVSSFSRRFALPPDRIGAMIAGALLVTSLLSPVGGLLADLCQRRGGARRTMLTLGVLALLSAPAALFPLMPNPTLAIIALSCFLTLGYSIGVAAGTLGTIVVPAEMLGLYLALTVTVATLFGGTLAPLIVSGLSGYLGGPALVPKALAIVCAVTSVLGAAVFGLGSRYFPGAARAGFTSEGVEA